MDIQDLRLAVNDELLLLILQWSLGDLGMALRQVSAARLHKGPILQYGQDPIRLASACRQAR
jgi:hypothetical protein